ncbi:MAG: zinc-binding dehydrogenase [Bacteroidota bacterium]
MKRQVYRLKAGSFQDLKLSEEEISAPERGEVLVDVKAIGLNFADVFAIWGLYGATPTEPFIPGLEFAGVVSQLGSETEGLEVGQRVMGVTRFGAYASHLKVDYRYLIPIPEDWDMSTGAAYLVQVLTAYYGLVELGKIEQGHTVLIHSAAGGVGTLANRIAKKFGAFTIGTVGSTRKVKFCQEEGYDQVIVRGKDFPEKLESALAGRDLLLVMECIGGNILAESFKRLAPRGRMVLYGSANYAQDGDRPNYLKLLWKFINRPKLDPRDLIESNRAVLGFNLIYLHERVELMHQMLAEVGQLGIKAPMVGHRYAFNELPTAVRFFRSGQSIGKVVVER